MSEEFHPHIVTPEQQPTQASGLWFLPLGLFLLRSVAGFTFAIYGAQLVFGLFGGSGGTGHPQAPFTLLWFAGILEFFGGLLVCVGLLTRPVAFILSGEMAFAFFHVHFPEGWNPVRNGGETAVLFCFIFLYLATTGPGPFSIERIFAGGRRS